MKKTLIALAAVAATSAAFAQSNVTLFGVVDAAIQVANGTTADRTALVNSGYNSSRFGVRGTEDLGGGLKANFWLEGALSNDDGNATGFNFQRRSLVGLEGGFGKIELGREYTPHFWNQTVYDPFGTNGAGTSAALNTVSGGGTTVRSNNVVNYYTPAMSGFTLQVQVAQGEALSNAAAPDAGNMTSARLSYANGPLTAAVSSGKTNVSKGVDITSTNFGASYDLGVAKLMGSSFKDEKTGAIDTKGYVVGLHAPLGAGTLRFAMSESKAGTAKAEKTAVGYVYGLSKRTDLYTTYANTKFSGGASDTFNGATNPVLAGTNGKVNVFEAGVKRSF